MQNLSQTSRTDWERVRNTPEDTYIVFNPEDELYNPNDEAEVDAFFDTAVITHGGVENAPAKKVISMRLSEDVLNHYTAAGEGWQERVEEVLRKAMG